MADSFAHAAHLAVTPLVDHDAEHIWGRERHLGGLCLAVFEQDPLAQRPYRSRLWQAHDLCQVLLVDSMARMREQLREHAVVGEDDQPFGSASSRPTGKTRGLSGTSSTTTGRPWGSAAVVTTPAGLLSR